MSEAVHLIGGPRSGQSVHFEGPEYLVPRPGFVIVEVLSFDPPNTRGRMMTGKYSRYAGTNTAIWLGWED